MKIAHICLSVGKGGAEKQLVDNLPYNVEQGHEVTIIQLSSIEEEPAYIDSVEKAGIKLVSLSKGSFLNPVIFFRLLKLVRSTDFDILHVHLFPCLYYASFAARLLKKYPVLVFTEHSSVNRRQGKAYLRPLEQFMYKKFDAIIAVSHNVESMLKKTFPGFANKITTINNGINIEKINAARAYKDDYFREKFNLLPGDVKLFMTARFTPPKDHSTVVKALARLPKNYHLFFAGDGHQLNTIKQLATNLHVQKQVHFLGFRTDVPELMKSADVNILSSLHEGFSGVTQEALAAAKPFLGTDVLGINDIVPGEDFLFKKEDAEDLAEKILAIINDRSLNERMLHAGAQRVKQFDTSIMIAKHIELYNGLLNRIRPGK